MSDGKPKGSGELNRHGMPKLPVGQTLSKKWPVLDLGVPPHVAKETFRLVADGAVENPYEIDFGTARAARLELMVGDRAGFCEQRGYSMTANPWRDDRYG